MWDSDIVNNSAWLWNSWGWSTIDNICKVDLCKSTDPLHWSLVIDQALLLEGIMRLNSTRPIYVCCLFQSSEERCNSLCLSMNQFSSRRIGWDTFGNKSWKILWSSESILINYLVELVEAHLVANLRRRAGVWCCSGEWERVVCAKGRVATPPPPPDSPPPAPSPLPLNPAPSVPQLPLHLIFIAIHLCEPMLKNGCLLGTRLLSRAASLLLILLILLILLLMSHN